MMALETVKETLLDVCKTLESNKIDYRVTGIIASNIYGRGLSTNVIDIDIDKETDIMEVLKILGLPKEGTFEGYEPYVFKFPNKEGFIRIQNDKLGESMEVPELGIKVQSKPLVLKRMLEYGKTDGRAKEQAVFLALTIDAKKTEKYKDIWNTM